LIRVRAAVEIRELDRLGILRVAGATDTSLRFIPERRGDARGSE
jgi:hypothetical protein